MKWEIREHESYFSVQPRQRRDTQCHAAFVEVSAPGAPGDLNLLLLCFCAHGLEGSNRIFEDQSGVAGPTLISFAISAALRELPTCL